MLSVCSDQGGRKKTKIVHLPAENATEIAEEMTARFRKLQSKTNKQVRIYIYMISVRATICR